MKTPKMNGNSLNSQEKLLSLFRKNFPEIFAEGRVDCEKLKKSLGENLDENGERYGLSWAGKTDCFRQIQESTTATLKPNQGESVNFDETKNLFIEGDNLQVLRILQKSYYGKVKMIYIDPPYNTGNDSFIYPDKFQESREDYLERVGERDEEGNLMQDGMFQKNSRDNGHYHSNWLSMMYPRLFLARNLLKQDGVIFVSIDDNEVHNLRMIMNEIFGEENFVAKFVWKKRTAKSDVPFGVSQDFEWIICYAKEGFLAGIKHERKYYQTNDFPNDRWRLSDLTKQTSAEERPNSAFELIDPKTGKKYPHNPRRTWAITENTFQDYYNKGKIVFPDDYKFLNISIPAYRVFESEDKAKALKKYGTEESTKVISTHLPKDVGMSENGNKEMFELFKNKIFSFPKPSSLIKYLVNVSTSNNDIILDFFAGSGTTAHAVMALNAEDGGSRKCISVQLPELCAEDSEAAKAGHKTIADIAKERIRRAGKKIMEGKNGKLDFENQKLDLGFRVFKLDESNFKIWRSDISTVEELKKQMDLFVDNVRQESTQENILYELILKSGLDLNVPIEKKEIDKKQYFVLGEGELIICLEDKISKKLVDKIFAEKPQKVVCLDRAFGGNDQLKTNTILQAESEEVEFKVI